MVKRQEFRTLKTYSEFEIREYAPCVVAEVKTSANYSDAGSSAFRSLFSYISQGNKTAEKIAMTAPVITAQKSDNLTEDEWFVSFVMPAGSTLADMPLPIDSRVVLRELGAEICVAASFRGKATTALSAKKIARLRAAAEKENVALSEETRVARFDPPFKPSFLQYNEIVIPTI
jgi:hypothetical protein